MTEGYPLEAARTLREAELETARVALGEREGALEAARAALETARAALEAHRAVTRRVEEREGRLDAGGRTADEMMRTRDYLERRRREEQAACGEVEARGATVREAEAARDAARDAVADARAARRAVDEHRERWDDARAKVAERRAEAEADDLVAGRRHGRGSGEG